MRIEPLRESNSIVPAPGGAAHLVLEDQRAQRLRSINNWQQVQAALDALPGVDAVSSIASGPAFARRGEAREAVARVGVDAARFLEIVPIDRNVVAGEFRVRTGEAAIGRVLADNLGARVGDKLRLDAGQEREAVVDVAGIFELGVRDIDERQIYVDLEQAQALLGLPGGVTVIEATVPDIFTADAVAERIARLLAVEAQSWMETNS